MGFRRFTGEKKTGREHLLTTLSDGSRHEMKRIRYRFTATEKAMTKQEFLNALEESGSVIDAAAFSGVTVNMLEAWRELDPDFSNRWSVIENRFPLEVPEQQAAFLDHLRRNYNPHKAASMLGVRYSVVQKWLDDDPLFKQKYDETIEATIDDVEEALWRLAQANEGRATLSAQAIMLNSRRKGAYGFHDNILRNQPVTFNLVVGAAPVLSAVNGGPASAQAALSATVEDDDDYIEGEVEDN